MFKGGTDQERLATSLTRDPDAPVGLDEVLSLAEAAGVVVGALAPGDVLFADAVAMWEAFSLLSRLGSAGSTLMARRVDESGAWRRAGYRNVEEFLAALGGESVGDARKQRQASERLTALPETEEELRKGRLSPGQRDAVTDGAAANPGAERQLLDDAQHKSLKDLKDDAARAKAAADRDPGATQDRIRRERRFTTFPKPDGSHGFSGQGPVEDVAVLEGALRPIVDRMYRAKKDNPVLEDRQALWWDAMIELARARLRDPDPHTTGQNTDSSDDSESGDSAESGGSVEFGGTGGSAETGGGVRKAAGRGVPPYLGIIRMDLAALTRGWVEGDELCEITGLGPIPVTRARELLGESTLRLVLTKGIDVHNVTYLGRGVNAAQNIALLWSQPFCSNIACPNTFCQRDHRTPYATVRVTELRNIDNLCAHCHDLKTRRNWALAAGTGRRAFVPPDHPHHPNNNNPPPAEGTSPPPDIGTDPTQGTSPPPDDPPELFPDTG